MSRRLTTLDGDRTSPKKVRLSRIQTQRREDGRDWSTVEMTRILSVVTHFRKRYPQPEFGSSTVRLERRACGRSTSEPRVVGPDDLMIGR
jgi:hypothetical protein